jgi:hypothetical protein
MNIWIGREKNEHKGSAPLQKISGFELNCFYCTVNELENRNDGALRSDIQSINQLLRTYSIGTIGHFDLIGGWNTA